MSKIGLVVTMYNRPHYVAQCFRYLERITSAPYVVVVDDASTELMPILGIPHDLIRQAKNKGVKVSLQTGIEHAISKGCDIIVTLDSDAIVKPDFIELLTELHLSQNMVVSGFNNPKEKEIRQIDKGVIKQHANGINMCFSIEQYNRHIKTALSRNVGNWDMEASELLKSVAITVPSCVQHIGIHSSMGHKGADKATDFKIQLPSVTLFGIDSHDVKGINKAAEISRRHIEYCAVNIITQDLFKKNGSREERRKDYSRFMIKELNKHFNTSHVLTIHSDGYVVNPYAWDDSWLQYDYIGATWLYKDGMNVGNGGFSLRSKKICDILADSDLSGGHFHPEDYHICRTYRPALERLGIKFAPEEVANKFSIEAYGAAAIPHGNAYSGQFGFHGHGIDVAGCHMHGVEKTDFYFIK